MPRAVKRLSSRSAKSASARACAGGGRRGSVRGLSAREFAALSPPGGARILTRAEALALSAPLKPEAQTGHEWLREMTRPIREYNIWCAKNGREVLAEMDPSLRGRGE